MSKEKFKKNKKALIGISIAVAIVVIIIGVIVVQGVMDAKQEMILNEELETISKKEVGVDNFKTDIKTTGDYAKVEETIKNYLQEYSDAVKAILDESKEIENMQGVVEKDKLEERINQVQAIKTRIGDTINTMVEMTSEDYIKKEIEQQNLSQKYVDLYNKLMLEDVADELEESKQEISTNKEKMDELFDAVIKTYNYLLTHEDSWIIEDEQLLFYSTTELKEYNQLVEEVQTKANSLASN